MGEDGLDHTGVYVGVSTRPDGSLDFSRSLKMIGEAKISDPVVDRLRGPIQVNQAKEVQYRNFQTEMHKKQQTGELLPWLVTTLNSVKSPDQPEITAEDLASLNFQTNSPEAEVLSRQFGYHYIRPAFKLDLGDFQKVYKKLTGHLGSNGCVISGGALDQNPLTRIIGLSLSSNSNRDSVHEAGHTIDPHFQSRFPQDQVLEEFATFYRTTYIPERVTQTTWSTDGSGRKSEPVTTSRETVASLPYVLSTLKNEPYTVSYGQFFGSQQEYKQRVEDIGRTIQALEAHMSKTQINTAIYNAKSADELKHLLDVVTREKAKT